MEWKICFHSPSNHHKSHVPHTPGEAGMKISSLKRHHETKRRDFEETFPQNSEVRTTKINALKSSYQAASRILVTSLTQQQKATVLTESGVDWGDGHNVWRQTKRGNIQLYILIYVKMEMTFYFSSYFCCCSEWKGHFVLNITVLLPVAWPTSTHGPLRFVSEYPMYTVWRILFYMMYAIYCMTYTILWCMLYIVYCLMYDVSYTTLTVITKSGNSRPAANCANFSWRLAEANPSHRPVKLPWPWRRRDAADTSAAAVNADSLDDC